MNKTTSTKKKNPQYEARATKVLRTVTDREAFYFYENIGKPTGDVAKNLLEFREKVRSAKEESLRFHQQRKDFEKWVEKTLGDYKLARQLKTITVNGDFRTKIHETVDNRLKELTESSLDLRMTIAQPYSYLVSKTPV